ncbi:hypothetical protein M426DRAFT_18298 [Hypoxylon sp. CI-4A]|nr:hypothetical protein M426DRAFT_18298 [Hypoxylon sp. CI-4A]
MTDQDKYSDIQQDMSEPDPQNVIRGHKATLSNPNTSSAAKEHSRRILENETDEPVDASNHARGVRNDANNPQDEHKDPGNVARGLKASISNQNVSDEARERAKEKLRTLEE